MQVNKTLVVQLLQDGMEHLFRDLELFSHDGGWHERIIRMCLEIVTHHTVEELERCKGKVGHGASKYELPIYRKP